LIGVKTAVHLIGAKGDGDIRRDLAAQTSAPHGVRIRAVPNIAARQRLRIATQAVVHVIAVKRGRAEIILHVHTAGRDVQLLVEQGFLRVSKHEMHGNITA
jgi:hypothetical protein